MYTVSAGGFNTRYPSSFMMYNPNGLNDYLLLLIKTQTQFTINTYSFEAPANSLMLIDRNTTYRYHSINGDYMDDWIHFDCDNDEVIRSTGLVFNEPIFLPNPSRFSSYIQQILWENTYAPEPWKKENVSMMLQILVNNIAAAYSVRNKPKQYSPYYISMQNLRLSVQAAPLEGYTVASLAEQLEISVSYFQHLYSSFFGISFQADLINMRIEQAKSLLYSTDLPVGQIAEMCGYSSEVHFYRQFRQKLGVTPANYRNSRTGLEHKQS